MARKAFVTGAHGFIGRHLVDRLTLEGWDPILYDRPQLIEDSDALTEAMSGCEVVYHLAALADVRNALKQPVEQVQGNFMLTHHVLEAMRRCKVYKLFFMSTAVVYGDTHPIDVTRLTDSAPRLLPINERSYCFPQQTSIYGACKLASESLIAAYCKGYGMAAHIFRTVSLVGAGYRHGNLVDFYRKLQVNPRVVEVFGSGKEQKYYIDVHDVMDAIMLVMKQPYVDEANIWNISHHLPNTIDDSVDVVCQELSLEPQRAYTHSTWIGDLPSLVLDCTKLRRLGWEPKVAIIDGMRDTVRDLIERGI